MYKNRKSTTLIALALVLTLLPISVGESRDRSTTEQQPMGPYDIAVLPLEEIPEPGPEVYRQRLKTSYAYESNYATPEILRVLKDPRSIPLDRFLYYKDPFQSSRDHPKPPEHLEKNYARRIEQSKFIVKHPDADQIIDRFTNNTPSAVAVYVRSIGGLNSTNYDVNGTPSQHTWGLLDPFYVQDPVNDFFLETSPGIFPVNYPWNPWSPLGVSDPESNLVFPCMPQQVFHPGESYENPDTGDVIDPASFLPPKPWYGADSLQIHEGEAREGWLLCLAPDIPVEEIELVAFEAYERDVEKSNKLLKKDVVWTTPYYKQMGEWHLLPDMQVVAWNGPIADTQAEFNTLDLHEVYRGDVWISIASAFTSETPPELDRVAYSGMSIQLEFEGMNDLLQTWEHVALKEWLSLEFCLNRQLLECVKADQHSEPDGTMIEVPYPCPEGSIDCPDTHLVETSGYFNSILAYSPGDWLEAPILEKNAENGVDVLLVGLEIRSGVVQTNRKVPGRNLAWHLEPQVISIPQLSTHAICEKADIDCIPEDALFLISTGEPDNSPPVLDGPIPIIPFGQSANGIRIINAYTSDDPVLVTDGHYDLDMRLMESESVLSDFQWLIVEIEVQGFSDYLFLYNEIEDGSFVSEGGGGHIIYPNNGPYLAIKFPWVNDFRSGFTNHGVFTSIPYDMQPTELILIIKPIGIGGGPAYELLGKID